MAKEDQKACVGNLYVFLLFIEMVFKFFFDVLTYALVQGDPGPAGAPGAIGERGDQVSKMILFRC